MFVRAMSTASHVKFAFHPSIHRFKNVAVQKQLEKVFLTLEKENWPKETTQIIKLIPAMELPDQEKLKQLGEQWAFVQSGDTNQSYFNVTGLQIMHALRGTTVSASKEGKGSGGGSATDGGKPTNQ